MICINGRGFDAPSPCWSESDPPWPMTSIMMPPPPRFPAYTPADAWASARQTLGQTLSGWRVHTLGKRLGTCHNSRRHLPSGQATGVCHGVCHGVCCKAPAMAPAMHAQAHAMQAPAHAMRAPAHAMGHMPCNRTTRGQMV